MSLINRFPLILSYIQTWCPWHVFPLLPGFAGQKVQQARQRTQTDGESKRRSDIREEGVVASWRANFSLPSRHFTQPIQNPAKSSLHWLAETSPSRTVLAMECHWLFILAVVDKSTEKHRQCGLTFIHSFYIIAPKTSCAEILLFLRDTPFYGHVFMAHKHTYIKIDFKDMHWRQDAVVGYGKKKKK